MIPFAEALQQLRDTAAPRRREFLRVIEQEWSEEDVARFCKQARDLPAAKCIDLCAVFANAVIPQLADLLGDYALREEESLRTRALSALSRMPSSSKDECIRRLLASPRSEVRIEACRQAATLGNDFARNDLVGILQDSDEEVIGAALEALCRLACSDAVDDIAALVEHASDTVRVQAIETLVDLARPNKFPVTAIARSATGASSETVRRAACWALGRRPCEQGEEALIQALANDAAHEVRTTAAAALGPYPTPRAIRALIDAGTGSGNATVGLEARRALNEMPEESIFSVCRELIASPDESNRMRIVSILGALHLAESQDFLIALLDKETSPVVRAALAEAFGDGEWEACWPALLRLARDEFLVAYSAINALGRLLNAERLTDYCALFTELHEPNLQEALLRRIIPYGRTNGLPEAAMQAIRPLLHADTVNIRLNAIVATSCSLDPDDSLALIDILDECDDPAIIDAVAIGVMKLCENRLDRLLHLGGTGILGHLDEILRALTDPGPGACDLCLELAGFSIWETPEAMGVLWAIAEIHPQILGAAINRAEGVEVRRLIGYWRQLPESVQTTVPLEFSNLLACPYDEVRLAAIDAMNDATAESLLDLLVAAGVSSGEAMVRQKARDRVRRIIVSAPESAP